MTEFVLVHGSGQNATSWSRVGDVLTARGHTVAAPDLPKKAAEWRLQDHASLIAQAVTGPDTIVVAHSFSGTFLPLVPQIRDCGLLVFFAAVVPQPGHSVRDQFAADPSMFHPDWIKAGARWFDEAEIESLAREFLLHDCDEPTLAWGLRSLEMMDTRKLVTEACPLTTWPKVEAAYVVATGDLTLSPDWGRRRSREALGREPIEIDAGHCPHVSRPDEVATILERLAARGSSGQA